MNGKQYNILINKLVVSRLEIYYLFHNILKMVRLKFFLQ